MFFPGCSNISWPLPHLCALGLGLDTSPRTSRSIGYAEADTKPSALAKFGFVVHRGVENSVGGRGMCTPAEARVRVEHLLQQQIVVALVDRRRRLAAHVLISQLTWRLATTRRQAPEAAGNSATSRQSSKCGPRILNWLASEWGVGSFSPRVFEFVHVFTLHRVCPSLCAYSEKVIPMGGLKKLGANHPHLTHRPAC